MFHYADIILGLRSVALYIHIVKPAVYSKCKHYTESCDKYIQYGHTNAVRYLGPSIYPNPQTRNVPKVMSEYNK